MPTLRRRYSLNICSSFGFDQITPRHFLIPNFLSRERGPTFKEDAQNRPEDGGLMRFGRLAQGLTYQ